MKQHLYSLLAATALLLLAPKMTQATPNPDVPTENPAAARKANAVERTAAAQKAAAANKAAKARFAAAPKARKLSGKLRHTMLVALGLEESKEVTSPHQLRRRLHQRQNQLKQRARQQARARRARCARQMS